MDEYQNRTKQAKVFYKSKAILGEGPVWWEKHNALLWVDILEGQVHSMNVNTGKDSIIYKGNKTSCIVLVSQEEIVITDSDKLLLLHTDDKMTKELADFGFSSSNIRFNDGKADPYGNFWIGSMAMDAKPKAGCLYRVNGQLEEEKVLDDVTISNGMAWSADKKTMFYIDTSDQVVYASDFNDHCEITNRRIVIQIPEKMGAPDGMCIDANGNLWVALWGGNAVACWSPETGEMIQKIEVDAPHITSCAFGGKNLDTLFITTARDGLSAGQLERYPDSGSIFYIQPGITGLIPDRFAYTP